MKKGGTVKMLFPNTADWDRWTITDDLHRYFLLLWAEMLDEHTLDTWQVRTCNVRTLLAEVVAIVEVSKRFEPYRHNLPPLLEELKLSATMDSTLARHFPFARRYVDGLKLEDLDGTARKARVILGDLQTYGERLVEDVRAALSAEAKEKEALRRATMALVTHLSTEGYSLRYLSSRIETLMDASKPFLDRFDAVIAECTRGQTSYECVFCVAFPKQLASDLPTLNRVTFTRGKPAYIASELEEQFFGRPGENAFFARTTVTALDDTSARRGAEARLAAAFAGLKLLHPRRSFSIQGTAALVSGGGQRPLLVERDGSRYGHVKGSRAFGPKLRRLAQLQETLAIPDLEQLNAALHYHNLALSSSSDEARLVNLWIALECLVDSSDGKIIANVTAFVAPSLAGGNLRKILGAYARYVTTIFKLSGPTRLAQQFATAFPTGSEEYIDPLELFETLRDVKEGARVNALFEIVGENLLLRQKLDHLRRRVVADAEAFANNLSAHCRNVDWQLRRIYRARNEVAHRARSPIALRHLLQHLHTYFVQFAHNLIRDLSGHPGWTIADALEYRRSLFEHSVAMLRSKETAKTLDFRVLLYPEQIVFGAHGRSVWAKDLGAANPKRQAPTLLVATTAGEAGETPRVEDPNLRDAAADGHALDVLELVVVDLGDA